MKNIHLLSANSPVQTLGIGFELGINNYIFLNGIMQNIHITNNDEIKDGDWIYRRKDGYETIQKATFPLNLTSINKKIILTTDSKLIADGVQAIPVDFLEWFVKNPSCEEVEVKKWFDYESIPNTTYEIITPKEEPKYSVKKEYVDDQDAYGYDVNYYKIIIPKEEQDTMKNIHIIPTDKPSRLYDDGLELYLLIKASNSNNDLISYKNIYITSDEEIKEGDWHLVWLRGKWEVLDYMPSIGYRKECLGKEVCKVILTTDQDLIKDGIQAISTEFLEWFVKNPSCEEVEVMNVPDFIYETKHSCYKIIIPKEEPKQDFPMQKLIDIMENDEGLKPKQETLEEITEQIQKDCHKFVESIISKVTYQDATNTFLFMKLAELILKLKKYE